MKTTLGNLKKDDDTARFVELVEEHEEDTTFDYQPDGDGWGEDEYEYFVPFANAFRHLCKERGEEWAKTHDWEFDAEVWNQYDVRIVEK